MRKTLMAIVLTAALLLLASAAAARNIYVNNVAGNDKSSGSQPATATLGAGPVQTIARALRLAQSADRIVLAATGQPYRESISLVGSRHSGTPGEPLVIEGHAAVLDGSAPVPPVAWEYYRAGVYRFRPPHVGFQQLFLGDRPLARVPAGMPAARPPKLDPLQWCLHGALRLLRRGAGQVSRGLSPKLRRPAGGNHAVRRAMGGDSRLDRAGLPARRRSTPSTAPGRCDSLASPAAPTAAAGLPSAGPRSSSSAPACSAATDRPSCSRSPGPKRS